MIAGSNGRRSKLASASERLRNVHVAIMSDDADLVCDDNYVAAKATYIRLLHGKIGFLGFFRP